MKRLSLFLFVMSCLGACSRMNETIMLNDHEQTAATRSVMNGQMVDGDASHQMEANMLYEEICKTISIKADKPEMGNILPDYLGGAYTDESGRLTILIKGNIEDGRQEIQKVVGDNQLIDYKACQYSYQELSDILSHISKSVHTMPKHIWENLCVYYLEDKENCIIVGLTDISSERIREFQEHVCNHKAIRFVKSTKQGLNSQTTPKLPQTSSPQTTPKTVFFYFNLMPGAYYSNRDSNVYDGSWAFRARDVNDTTIVGMVTATHVIDHDSAFIDGFYIGYAPYKVETTSVDASLVHIIEPQWDVQIFVTNELCCWCKDGYYPILYGGNDEVYEGELATETNSPIYGTPINKRGWTTGWTTGTVQSTNFCLTFQNEVNGPYITVENMTRASFISNNGDSGGVVYTYYSIQNKRYTTGIVGGKLIDNNNNIIGTYFTKAPLALSTLGIERY